MNRLRNWLIGPDDMFAGRALEVFGPWLFVVLPMVAAWAVVKLLTGR
jgi:hypothetical protein